MKFLGAILFTLTLVNLGCGSSAKKDGEAAGDKKEFPKQMESLASDVRDLLPYLYNRDAFHDPKNKDSVYKALQRFSGVAHKINPETGKKFLGDDLLVEYSLASLQDDLGRAVKSFEAGQLEYSRSVAKASLAYCFQCHSSQQANSQAWDIDQLQTLNIAPLEKADLLVALRKFDKAIAFMETQLSSPDFGKNYAFDYEAMLRRYLALVIRVENAPRRAFHELNKILEKKDLPKYIAEQADGWRNSLKKWNKEKKKPVKNPAELFAAVEKRFKSAEASQKFEKDHAGDVDYLRATALLHENLKMLKKPADEAKALYYLGRSYEVLNEIGSWNLHENYYEACIDHAPKVEIAKSCYSRLEASLYMGYSGSSGTHLPKEEADRLKRLKDRMQ